jgi:hypothetical protein
MLIEIVSPWRAAQVGAVASWAVVNRVVAEVRAAT